MPDISRSHIHASPALRFLLRHLGEVILAFSTIMVLGLAAFSYRMLYQTFTEAQAIAVLRTQVTAEDFDRVRFERVQSTLRARAAVAPTSPATVRDPFAFPAPTQASFRQPSRPTPRP